MAPFRESYVFAESSNKAVLYTSSDEYSEMSTVSTGARRNKYIYYTLVTSYYCARRKKKLT